ncbi:predicted protein [Botrytis cinerea T4]|uniref:Uncharacterized protein n=1 Tax=Botryotinia fuckeliana (strain T4) TaxID=999810 RepID=G2YSZ4_BOTF4|nr:predicted protein [Botrytis cinerea T4]
MSNCLDPFLAWGDAIYNATYQYWQRRAKPGKLLRKRATCNGFNPSIIFCLA